MPPERPEREKVMKPHAFLIPIVLGVAGIAVVALLNWTPDSAAPSQNALCEVEDPLRPIFLKPHGDPNSPAILTSVPPCRIVRFMRVPGAITCYFIKESGKSTWYLYPNPRAANIASMHAWQGNMLVDMRFDQNYNMEIRHDDRFLVNVPSADFLAFGTFEGGASCLTLKPVL